MGEFKIDKGLPIPEKRGRTSKIRQAMEQMDIGDSFFIEEGRQSQRTYICLLAKRMNKKGCFTTALFPDGLRVWRIK